MDLRIDLNVTADGGDQIIFKGIKFGRSQIRAVMDEDKLQALLGAIRTVLSFRTSDQRSSYYFLPASRWMRSQKLP